MKNSARGELVEPCELCGSAVKRNSDISPLRRKNDRGAGVPFVPNVPIVQDA